VYPAIAAEAKRCRAGMHWLDETGVRTDHNPGTGYSPRGTPPVARVSGRPERVNAVSTLTNAGRVRFRVFAGRLTAGVLIGFLGRVLRGTTGAVVLILDSHPVHRNRAVAEWVSARSARVRLYFLPPYGPERNPTEDLNNAVKGGVPRFRRPRDKVELAKRVRLWLRVIQGHPQLARRYFEAQPVRYAANPLSLLSRSG
jgi:hypothetical protein